MVDARADETALHTALDCSSDMCREGDRHGSSRRRSATRASAATKSGGGFACMIWFLMSRVHGPRDQRTGVMKHLLTILVKYFLSERNLYDLLGHGDLCGAYP
jgi:hypothetical protein